MIFSLFQTTKKEDPRKHFRYPLRPLPRIAVFSDTLIVAPPLRRFHDTVLPDLRSAGVDTLAAPARMLSNADFRGWRPSHPIIAFTGVQHGFLFDYLRNRIWVELGVPVFEQLLDVDGRVIATECDAHSGLHLEPGVQGSLVGRTLHVEGHTTGLSARVVTGLCGCGRPGERLYDTRAAHISAPAAARASLDSPAVERI
ncbi:MAG TPA: hypothetical protein VEQ63_01165 [Bryobacteraceae bacterium]|nr:hypothetical protein [Bryobacteraceae bacterium]